MTEPNFTNDREGDCHWESNLSKVNTFVGSSAKIQTQKPDAIKKQDRMKVLF